MTKQQRLLWTKGALRKIRGMSSKEIRRHQDLSDLLDDIYQEANQALEKVNRYSKEE